MPESVEPSYLRPAFLTALVGAVLSWVVAGICRGAGAGPGGPRVGRVRAHRRCARGSSRWAPASTPDRCRIGIVPIGATLLCLVAGGRGCGLGRVRAARGAGGLRGDHGRARTGRSRSSPRRPRTSATCTPRSSGRRSAAFVVGGLGAAWGSTYRERRRRPVVVHRTAGRASRRAGRGAGRGGGARRGVGDRRDAAGRHTSAGPATCGRCSTRAPAAGWPWASDRSWLAPTPRAVDRVGAGRPRLRDRHRHLGRPHRLAAGPGAGLPAAGGAARRRERSRAGSSCWAWCRCSPGCSADGGSSRVSVTALGPHIALGAAAGAVGGSRARGPDRAVRWRDRPGPDGRRRPAAVHTAAGGRRRDGAGRRARRGARPLSWSPCLPPLGHPLAWSSSSLEAAPISRP